MKRLFKGEAYRPYWLRYTARIGGGEILFCGGDCIFYYFSDESCGGFFACE
ncbi:MAG: hypothetical protein LBJ00_02050 [Planctomycetaceae bacterium]|nr:hypothetical protein [Planctomycetaceae bacterium]